MTDVWAQAAPLFLTAPLDRGALTEKNALRMFFRILQIIKELRENGWMFGELHGEIGTTDFTLLPTGKG